MITINKSRKRSGWSSVFSTVPEKSAKYIDLRERRASALKELSNIIIRFDGKFDWQEADAIMQKLNIIDQTIIEANKEYPKEGFHDLISEK